MRRGRGLRDPAGRQATGQSRETLRLRAARRDDGTGEGAERGGLDCHGDTAPDFRGVVSVPVTVGAAFATFDTDRLATRMRRIATARTARADPFDAGIPALAVDMAAGLAPH